jgi:integral membrane sensor domain MASE1
MAFDLVTYLIGIVVSTIVIAPALWLSGRLIVGARKARFSDAILIVVIGTVIGGLVGAFFSGIIGSIVQLILWLALVRHYFDCGWFTAFIIAIIAVIAFIVVGVILGIIGFTLFTVFI